MGKARVERCACANTPPFLPFHLRVSAFFSFFLFFFMKSVAGCETGSPSAAMLAQPLILFFSSSELDDAA